MVDYKKIVCGQSLIHFDLIGDKSSKGCLWGGDTNIITNSVKLD